MSKPIAVCSLLLVAGCSAVDPRPALQQLQTDVSDRTSVKVDLETEDRGRDAIGRWVADTLAREMTPDDAVAVSLLKNPRLRALYREVGLAASDLVATALPENPTVSGERRFRGKSAEVDVSQDIVSLFLIPLRRRLGESAFESERLRITHEVIEHAAEVRAAYFRAQAAEQVADLRRSTMRAMDSGLVAAKAIRLAGNNAALDVALAERGSNQARLVLADAELEVAATRERLNVLLGLWGTETQWRIPGRLPNLPSQEPEPADLERQGITDRFDLASLQAEIEALAQAQGITRITSIFPELSVNSHLEREPEGKTTRGPGVSFPLSLFNRGQAARARAMYLLLQAEDRYAALAIEVRSEIRAAFARMETARKKASFYRGAMMPTQQTVTAETQLRYNGMFVGVFQLLDAKQNQIDTAKDYIETLAEYWLARSELERVLERRIPVGELSSSSVSEPSSAPMMHYHK